LIPTNRVSGDRDAPGAGGHKSAFALAGGEMATLIGSADWAATGLGPAEAWPSSLMTVLRILVTSRYQMWLAWGSDLAFFYNDAYAPTLGVKHPWALGQPAREVWREIWPDIGPRIESVLKTGHATWDEALLLFLERSGYPEETYHTFSYSPLPDDNGEIAGLLCVVMEETQRVIGERRVATLRDLASELGAVRSEPDVLDAVERSLARDTRDIPFNQIYLADGDAGRLRRATDSGGIGDSLAPEAVGPDSLPWPAGRILAGTDKRLLQDISAASDLPRGAWDTPPRQVVVVPIVQQGEKQQAGLFIAGLNPYRPFDEAYAGFIDLVAAQIASGLAAARAYEAERRRAEALAEIDAAKTAFFSNVSHEFRTPLTLMLGPLEEEIATRTEDAAAGRLRMVHRNGLRLLRLVNTLLDFSRIEAGRVQARYQPLELDRHTAELASNFRSACERAGLRLETRCVPLPHPVYADPEMWERIVLNLVSNAFKYTLSGEIFVGLAAAPGDAEAVLTVRDTGIGIPQAELPHIFDRFHRIEGQNGRTLEGTGIGLALVNELVRLHGGTIRVESQVGAGTTFSVSIPFGHAHLPPDRVSETTARSAPEGISAAAFVEEALRWLPRHEEAEDAQAEARAADLLETSSILFGPGSFSPAPEQQRPRILLADDNADMRDYVSRLLHPAYDIQSVRDGREALHAARATRPDLILSDVMMPRLDGFGLLAAIRADADLRDLPVILLSARAGEEARLEGLDAGADDYLVKPFSARELLARVRSNLDLARLRRAARDALRQANELLEQRVAEEIARRAQAEDSLRQAQKMEAIGHLTGGVAHDFNNLLTVIGGGVETLQRLLAASPPTGDDTKIKRALSMIAQGADRAATLTHRLLAFARRQTLDPKPLDANKLVAGMSELLRRTLGESVALETVLAGGLWRTIADANQLENVLLNLAVNARDAMPEGGRLTIETANTHLDDAYAAENEDVSAGQYVMIAVSDTGIGMDRDTLGRVFEPFFTTKDVGQGTGLGLSQVYGFIKQSNGHVKLYSEPGQGTAVKLYLPRLAADRPDVVVEEVRKVVEAGRGETILVVEDEAAVREHTVNSLKELGYQVLSAGDGAGALRMLARNRGIDLLFTDIGLPGGMTGRQLAEAARARRPDLKVVYTTGYARNAIVHGGLLDPGQELLPKPFSYTALASKVRAMLDS
jgi:signal transduction histidine kinase